MKKLREKYILREEDDLPAVELEEPVSVNVDEIQVNPEEVPPVQDEIPETVKVNAALALVNSAIASEWSSIDEMHSIMTTMTMENIEGAEEINKIIEEIITEKTMCVGMLEKVMELVSPETFASVEAGTEKAEDALGSEGNPDKPEEEKESEEEE